jgi:sulfur transfer protein SufE
VTVTLEHIYAKVLEIDKKVDPLPGMVRDHETRIRSLERQVWLWCGVSAVGGGGVVGAIVQATGAG